MTPLTAALILGAAVGVLAYGAALVALRAAGVLVPAGVEDSLGTNRASVVLAVAATGGGLAWLWKAWPRQRRSRRRLVALVVTVASGLYSVLAFAEMHLGSTVTVERGTWPAVGELVLLHGVGVWVCFASLARVRQLRPRASRVGSSGPRPDATRKDT